MSLIFSEQNAEGAKAFVTTDWSLVDTAQQPSASAMEALEKICRIYWQPLYAFVRREGSSPEEAQDLTQAFFARFLERRDLDVVRREKGRLRSYLLASLKNFLANERTRARTIKRGEGRRPVPLDDFLQHANGESLPASPLSAEQIFERRWALSVLEQVFARLQEEYRAMDKLQLFARFKSFIADDDRQSQAAIAREFAMNENAVKQAFHRFRQRYREILREEIARTVSTPADVEDELQHLVAVLRA